MKVEVSYKIHTEFILPKGLDLKDKTKIQDWYVNQDNLLVVEYIDGRTEEFESEYEPELHSYDVDEYTLIDDDEEVVSLTELISTQK